MLGAVLAVLLVNFDALLAPDTAAYLRWLLPAIPVAAAVVGLVWGLVLKSVRPEAYARIGRVAEDGLHEPGLHPSPEPEQDAWSAAGRR
ncbi:hypothetical protein OG799_17185 [Micromonospora sp. NBC_00898]|uniref:hypothetical protein n=1 Tax=Micromonospora sp. NBC_00898 TaxID=2975981 RepID=UPI003866DBEC|nr:hypothetical protein OG799_17185 [Micromonospora sp. NBC_00898]